MPEEFVTAKDPATQTRLSETSAGTMVQSGEIPAFKLYGQWRIKHTELDQWTDAQPQGGDGVGRGE